MYTKKLTAKLINQILPSFQFNILFAIKHVQALDINMPPTKYIGASGKNSQPINMIIVRGLNVALGVKAINIVNTIDKATTRAKLLRNLILSFCKFIFLRFYINISVLRRLSH